MLPRLTPMYCNYGLNKKRWKIDRYIVDTAFYTPYDLGLHSPILLKL